MRVIDLPTLLLILAAGFELGLQGWFGFSIVGWLFGTWKIVAYEVIGCAAIWQLFRQRFV